ncbi:MAG: MFS transporter [Oscillospiraceae bacterium]|nr:MFS transporter [Oscillospiraceae bacterium]
MKKLKRWQIPLFAFASFGPCMLSTIISVYLVDALQTAGFGANLEQWTFAAKTIIAVGLFSILKAVANLMDGLVEVPVATIVQNLKTPWGRRRPAILVGIVVMTLAYVLFCFPISNEEYSVANSIWCGVLLTVFVSFFTLAINALFGTYAEITANDNDRIFLTNMKAFFDTIQYSIAYALIPVFIGFGVNIRQIGLYMTPLVLTIVIALVLIKEDSTMPGAVVKYGEDVGKEVEEESMTMVEGLRLTLSNKAFRAWLVIHGCFNLGLQMFLSGQNVLISGPMGLNGFQIAIINSTAFAPVPLMLFFYRKVMAKKGYRFAFQTALASFALGMVFMSAAYVIWFPNTMVRLILGATGGVISSYGIGAFFSAPTAMPTQIAAEEKKRTGKSHPSMYFALQGIVNSIVGAIGPGLIWVNLRNVSLGGNDLFGTHAMTYIVIVFCVLAILACKLLPKEYDQLGRK